MYIRRGFSRIVVVLPYFGIVVKFPIIHLWFALKLFWRSMRSENRWADLKRQWQYPLELPQGLKGLLFGGLFANIREFKFYWQTRNPFLQSTYFSLGFLNIQRYSEQCNLERHDLWCQLHELTEGGVFDHPHCFSNPANFCLREGKLTLADYGSTRSHAVVIKYGKKIFQLFNPAYNWEEEKKKIP